MYIQITTRCNMTCQHCAFSCTSEGEDMTMETFRNAVDFDPEIISIGGGEPTLHFRFWEMIGYALGCSSDVWLATNGSVKESALTLAKLTANDVLRCELSQDEYHDYYMVDEEVYCAFDELKAIRDVTRNQEPIRAGRFLEYAEEGEGREGCACDTPIVKPNGDIVVCGCPDAPVVGNVNTDTDTYARMYEIYGVYDYETCHKVMMEDKIEREKEKSVWAQLCQLTGNVMCATI